MAPVGGAQQKPEVRTQNGDVLASDFRPLEFGFRLLKSLTMVGLGRLELPTSRLSGVRSNRLSYRPDAFAFASCLKKEKRRRRTSRSGFKDPVRFETGFVVLVESIGRRECRS